MLEMKIHELAKMSGVTVRTLHYYDEIGLLKPSEITEAGYRLYDEENIAALQQILFFRELGFSLNAIRDIMGNPHYDKTEALKKQKELLIQKRSRLDGLIALLDKHIKGENTMSFKEFDSRELEAARNRYADEVKARWGGSDTFCEYAAKTEGYDDRHWSLLAGEGAQILQQFSRLRHLPPEDNAAQELVEAWQAYISANFYRCTKEILSCLGSMYIEDERFQKNIDKNGEGTAAFMAKAIAVYCAV